MTDKTAEIKYRLNIVDVARRLGMDPDKGDFIKSIYKSEKTPSLRLYKKSNSYYCFCTSQGGDLIKFYQDACHIEFKQAVEELSAMAGIQAGDVNYSKPSAPQGDTTGSPASDDVTGCMTEEEKEIYFERLGMTENQSEALKEVQLGRLTCNKAIFHELYRYCTEKGFNEASWRYLTVERGLPEKYIKQFKLFFIKNYNEVNNHMKKAFPLLMLQNSGLYNRKEDGSGNLKFYAHRLIIPYLHKGEIIYLRGRYFDEDNNTKTDRYKYLGLNNDALGLNITKRFFNLDVTRNMLKGERLYLVEGEFDAIALESIGFNTLGIPGAGNMPAIEKFKALLQYDICLCMDNDEAGQMLQQKLNDVFKHYRKEYSIKELPAKDVNDFIIQN